VDLTNRQKLILKAIVEEHVRTAKPVSSNDIIKKYLPKISSATIRNEMMFLEKKMFLEKAHVSSGRIPSISCYKYYEKTILEPKIENNIKDKLEKIFMQRYVSIDAIIDQSVSIINESLKLPSVVTITNSKCFLKRFDLIEIDKKTVLIILVTSDGAINKNIIHFEDNGKYLDDICTCVRIFNDRLVNTKVEDICKKIDSIKEIIRKMVHEYEFCIKKIIEKIFDFKQTYKNNLYGIK
jgi:heat-inducible transcriptional repressor